MGPIGVEIVDEDVEVTLVALVRVRVPEELTDEEDSADELTNVDDADVTL